MKEGKETPCYLDTYDACKYQLAVTIVHRSNMKQLIFDSSIIFPYWYCQVVCSNLKEISLFFVAVRCTVLKITCEN